MRKQTSLTKSLPADPVTKYAVDVVSGVIVAGPHVRNACQRHINDVETGKKRGLVWNPKIKTKNSYDPDNEVDRIISFYKNILSVEVEYDEDGESYSKAVPFVLEPSQAFIVGSIFGWKRRGLRRFRRAYVEIGKGNGKSPLAAGIGHYMLTACRKLRAEVYSAATDKDQAAILFRDAVEMWNRSPELNAVLVPSGQNPVWQLTYIIKASFFKPISSEKKGKSGIRPFCSLVDEIHEHKDNSVIEMLRAGTKGNREALMFEITNSGYDRQSVCYQEHEYSINVCNGSIKNDAWFAYVCALDEGDDPFDDEECWIKANPLLGVSIHKDFIREQVVEAKGIPDKQSLVKRLHFCIWAESNNPLISVEKWLELKQESIEFEPGEKIYLALDLAETTDLCALAAVSASGGDRVQVWFWKPKNVLKEHEDLDRVPYRRWVESGLIEACEGGAIEHRYIADKIMELGEEYEICGMAYDAWNIKYLVKEFNFIDFPHYVDKTGEKDGDGLRMIPWSQSFSDMSPAVNSIETSVANKKLQHDGHPVLTWNVSNATVVRNTSGNRKLDKRLARQRIDGMQALTMAIGLKYREVEKEEDIIDENPFMEIDFQ